MQVPELKEVLQKYQNPSEADNLMRIQRELDETKIIMASHVDQYLFHSVL
jgi:synaptobrevin family protein YKT6